MPVINRRVLIAAGTTNENIIAGSQYEFARRRCLVSIGLNASAAGMLANINAGGDVIAEQFPIPAINALPVIPDNMIYNDIMEAGDRLSIPVQNPTGAGVDAICLVQIQDL